ncbi:argininosuccinate lyase [Myxococcota bacterium]|nr:argininosuccinate lyase [Myxococcota bacterium]
MSHGKLWNEAAPADPDLEAFTVGEDPVLDARLARWDAIGSLAHARVLQAAGLLGAGDVADLSRGLREVVALADGPGFPIRRDQEDVHTAVEQFLAARVGDAALRLHAGRSRNDQVLTDLRLWLKSELLAAHGEWLRAAASLIGLARTHSHVELPGYTHLQRAMPSSGALWAGGFAGALLDLMPLWDAAFLLADRCPLGSAAGYGAPLPLDRALAARLLGFARVEAPVTACQVGRGMAESAAVHALAEAAEVGAKLAWDVVLYASSEFALVRLPDAFTTGSSIMPQKRNPDVAELLRGRAAAVRAAAREIEDVRGKLPSGYHRDLQLTKPPLMRGIDSGRQALRVAERLAAGVRLDEAACARAMDAPLYATAEAVRRAEGGLPFRDAYRAVSSEVRSGTFNPSDLRGAPDAGADLDGLGARLDLLVREGESRRTAFGAACSALLEG